MKPLVTNLVEQGRRLLEAGDRVAAQACLAAALEIDATCLPAQNLIEEHGLDGNWQMWFGIDCRIHPDDDIFRYFARSPSCRNPIRDYLADGWRTMSELLRLMEKLRRPLTQSQRFLEFACGHGRFTRHLKATLDAGTLHVSDVIPGSVDFLRDTFGVSGFYSTVDPDALRVPGQFDTIFVLSLFSHLPGERWQAWLRRLYDALLPGGVLVISTHGDPSAKLVGLNIPKDGFLFFPDSESNVLAGSDYGCAYSSDAAVRQHIRDALGDVAVRRFPAHFWGFQDAYVMARPELDAV